MQLNYDTMNNTGNLIDECIIQIYLLDKFINIHLSCSFITEVIFI